VGHQGDAAGSNGAPIRMATFDCYGTLVDFQGGTEEFLYDLALRNGDTDPPPARRLRDVWEQHQVALIEGPYRSYKDILAESLRLAVADLGYAWDPAEGEAFVRAWRSFQPFPDTVAALHVVRDQGVRLVIVSNTDHDIIEHTLKHLGVPFDDVITAADCRAYKPAREVFEYVLERVGTPVDEMLHVAFGFTYDNDAAKRVGLRTAWVNRYVEAQPSGVPPDYEWRDLWGLAELTSGVTQPHALAAAA
jgi:2-haloacid dehalogenase